MDTGKGTFETIKATNPEELEAMMKALEEKHPDHGAWFREGETIQIKGSWFRVKRVKPTEITFKLLPFKLLPKE
jgi:hypothetical protein